MSQPILSHHLPRPAQNAAYLAVLAAAPLINLPINQSINQSINQWVFSLSEFALAGILALFAINLLRTLMMGHRQIRKTLLVWYPIHS